MPLDDTLQEIASLEYDPPPIKYRPLAALFAAMAAVVGWLSWSLMATEQSPADTLANQISLGCFLFMAVLIAAMTTFNWVSDRQGRRMYQRLRLLASVCQADLVKERGSVH